jgi:hypothetical protein
MGCNTMSISSQDKQSIMKHEKMKKADCFYIYLREKKEREHDKKHDDTNDDMHSVSQTKEKKKEFLVLHKNVLAIQK